MAGSADDLNVGQRDQNIRHKMPQPDAANIQPRFT
jgi:hypothetical protein